MTKTANIHPGDIIVSTTVVSSLFLLLLFLASVSMNFYLAIGLVLAYPIIATTVLIWWTNKCLTKTHTKEVK